MRSITTEAQLRAARRIRFCYLCGAGFEPGVRSTRDHVPPRKVFASSDRSPPLVLPVHHECNQSQSSEDEVIGQLVSLIHGPPPPKHRQRFLATKFSPASGSGPEFHGVQDLHLPDIIWRWVRAFHSALYGEFLPTNLGRGLMTPFPGGNIINGKLVMDEDRPHHREMAFTLKQHIALGRVDEVRCCNNKCRYVCTWLTYDSGEPFCLYGVRLYTWELLGDVKNFVKRGCVGFFDYPMPPDSARGTNIITPTTLFGLDPFS